MERLIPDDGCQFGIGAFETILVWNGCPVFLEEHLNRLAGAMEALGLLSAGGQKESGGAAERKRWKEHFREEIRGYLSGKEEKEGGLKADGLGKERKAFFTEISVQRGTVPEGLFPGIFLGAPERNLAFYLF